MTDGHLHYFWNPQDMELSYKNEKVEVKEEDVMFG